MSLSPSYQYITEGGLKGINQSRDNGTIIYTEDSKAICTLTPN